MIRFRQAIPSLHLVFLCLSALTRAAELAEMRPALFQPGEGAPAALPAKIGGVILSIPFDSGADRVYWDLPIHAPDPNSSSLALEMTIDDPGAIRAISAHLRCGDDWMSAAVSTPGTGRQTLNFHRSDFASEGGSPEWSRAGLLRISVWSGAARPSSIVLHAIRSRAHDIAIVRGSERTSPGEGPLALQCARRAQRLFEKAGVDVTTVDDDLERRDLGPFRWLVLPYNPTLSEARVDALDRFVRRGGRLAVFYNANPRLARSMGFRVDPFAGRAEEWSTIVFPEGSVAGLPSSMPHQTRNLLPVRADDASAQTLGFWQTPWGSPNRRLPAAAVSPRGIWFSHVPPLAYPSAVQWLLASVAHADSTLKP